METEQLCQDFIPFLTRNSVTKLWNKKVKNQDDQFQIFLKSFPLCAITFL